MNREQEQQKALSILLDLYKKYQETQKRQRGILKAVMRFGKSKVIIDFINQLNKDLQEDVLIVVPRIVNIDSWKEEMVKWKAKFNYEIITYTSLSKIDNIPSILIFDEIHRLTPLQYNSIKEILFEIPLMIGITGTLPRNFEKKEILNELGFNLIYELDIDEAIDFKIINNFKIRVVKVPLDTNTNINIKTGNFNFNTSEYKSYKYMTKRIVTNPTKKNRLFRSNFLYNLKSKITPVKMIISTILAKNMKVLTFTKRIEIANEISKYAIHSKVKNDYLQKFQKNEIKELVSVEMLNEGVTIPDIDIIIIESFDSNVNNLLQRIGRSLQYVEGKIITVFIIVAEDTIEEKWLEKIIPENINVEYYRYNNLTFKKYDN